MIFVHIHNKVNVLLEAANKIILHILLECNVVAHLKGFH